MLWNYESVPDIASERLYLLLQVLKYRDFYSYQLN